MHETQPIKSEGHFLTRVYRSLNKNIEVKVESQPLITELNFTMVAVA